MHQLEEKRYHEEDEIDLLELLRTILKHKKMIVLVTIVFTVIALLGGYLYNRNKIVNSVLISLDYPGVRDGKNPDGSNFSPNELIPISVIDEVYNKYQDEIKQKNASDFESDINVIGIIPDVIKTRIKQAAEKGEIFTYFPTKYEITTSNNALVLRDIVNKSMDNFIIEYKPNALIGNISSLVEYDYEEIQTILNDKINSLITIAQEREKSNFISTKLGYSFNRILTELKTIKKVDLVGLYSFTSINGLTIDREMRETRYSTIIRDLKLKEDSLIAKSQVVKQMLQDYKPKEKSIVLPNIGEIKSSSDEYYNKLIDEYLDINKQIKDTEFEIKKIENAKLIIKEPSAEEKKILNERIDFIIGVINKKIDQINTINKEYIQIKYANMIKVDSPIITINKGKPLYMFLVGGIILGLFFSLFLVFLAELKKEYRNKYSK